MSTTATPPPKALGLAPIGRAMRIGLRELRSGIRGFHIFISCLALGVMVIAAVGSLTDALKAGFAKQGQVILGGDLTFSRMHTRARPDEIAAFAALGTVSETATMRTMARTSDGNEQALVEMKAVDGAYPLAGDFTTEGATPTQPALADNGAIADPVLLQRLGLKSGDSIKIGEAKVVIRAVLGNEPDAISDRAVYGPRIFVSFATLDATGLVKPGTLVDWRYAIRRPAAVKESRDELKSLRGSIERRFPQSGFASADRYDPAPRITRALDRLRQFLILIGLASLLVGGVGVGNAVSAFIDKRMKVIATLRSIGATGSQIIAVFLTQILVMAFIGIAIGLALGFLVPPVLEHYYGDLLLVRVSMRVAPGSLVLAACYGLLVALLFALWPLGLAERVRAAALFRDTARVSSGWPRRAIVVASVAIAAALVALAVSTSDPRRIAVYVCAGLAFMLVAFGLLGRFAGRLAAMVPRPASPIVALALKNVAAPDGLARSVVLSLGIGLSLLIGVALANGSLVADLSERLPGEAPDYFLIDIPSNALSNLSAIVERDVPGSVLSSAPMLRGRIVSINGTAADDLKVPADAKWVLSGDRGLSYSDAVPEGSKLEKGDWWPKDYAGPPLVSFEGALAKKIGISIGDTVTVSVLGRAIAAKVANFREVKWENIGINFVMVFSPNTLQAAPHNLLATLRFPANRAAGAETAMVRDLARAYPSVGAIRVRDAIDEFRKIFAKVMVAIQAAGSVTLLAGGLVLAGALATAQRRRILEAVILKTIGARRRQILSAHMIEYALLMAIAGLLAIGIGTLLSWIAVRYIMEVDFVFSPAAVLRTLGVAAAMVMGFGGIGSWLILRSPPVPYLRSE